MPTNTSYILRLFWYEMKIRVIRDGILNFKGSGLWKQFIELNFKQVRAASLLLIHH